MPESVRQRFARWRLEELLLKYPGLRLTPENRGWVSLAGTLAFAAQALGRERIDDEYDVEIAVPEGFPVGIPSVRETANRIPSSFHKLKDGALCLGSPTRLRLILFESPSLLRFVERCVIPYFYGHSYFERHGTLPFGELQHGESGIRQDFASLFGVDREDVVREFVRLTSLRKRHANKQPCPCGSRRRLGRCHHRRVNRLRDCLGRRWFAWYAILLETPDDSGCDENTSAIWIPPLGPRSGTVSLPRPAVSQVVIQCGGPHVKLGEGADGAPACSTRPANPFRQAVGPPWPEETRSFAASHPQVHEMVDEEPAVRRLVAPYALQPDPKDRDLHPRAGRDHLG